MLLAVAPSMAMVQGKAKAKVSVGDGEAKSLVCVESGSGDFRWKDDEAKLKEFRQVALSGQDHLGTAAYSQLGGA